MRRILLVLALAAGAALALPETANAQHYHPRHAGGWSAGFGYGVPSYGYGSGYHGYPWRYRGHYDFQPGHFHGRRYIPPHIDYHHRGHYHAVDPYTGRISPFPHRHRHHHHH